MDGIADRKVCPNDDKRCQDDPLAKRHVAVLEDLQYDRADPNDADEYRDERDEWDGQFLIDYSTR